MASRSRFMVDSGVSFKDTSHAWKAIICVMSVYLFTKVQGTIHTACTKSNTSTAGIPLTCSSDQMIHVISELYGRGKSKDNCTVVRPDSNTKVFDSSTNGLIVVCNGYTNCTEQAACGTNCNGSGNAYKITYECVKDSKYVCDVFNQTGPLPSLYLHSPMFPASQEEERSCECTVSGQSLDVLMIQHRGRQGVLQITTTGADNNTWRSKYTQFNTKIASDARHVVVTYTNHTDGNFWLSISGNITHASCSNSLTSQKTTGTTKATGTTQTIEMTEVTEATETIETINTTEAIEATEATGHTETIGSAETTKAIKGTEAKETPEVTAIMTEAIEITTKTGITASVYSNMMTSGSWTVLEYNTKYCTVSLDYIKNIKVSPTTAGDGSSSQTTSAATRSDIIVPAAVSGGVFLLIALIIITVFFCRKKKMSARTMKIDSDIQLTSDHDDARGNDQLYDNKLFEENQESVDMIDCIVENDLYHSNKSRSIVNKGHGNDDQGFAFVAIDLYDNYQAGSKPDIDPKTCPIVNDKYPVSEAPTNDAFSDDNEDVEEKGEYDTPMADVDHILESGIANVALTPEMIENVDEDVMVTNDLYHSYKSHENLPIPQDIDVQEEIVTENNDLYQENRNPEIMPIAQEIEGQEELVMEDNDLYHSYKKQDN